MNTKIKNRGILVSLAFLFLLTALACNKGEFEGWVYSKKKYRRRQISSKGGLVYRSTCKWEVNIYQNGQKFMKVYKPEGGFTFSDDAELEVYMLEDTISGVILTEGCVNAIKSFDVSPRKKFTFSVSDIFCKDSVTSKYTYLQLVIFTNSGYREVLGIRTDKEGKERICD